jgi:hypothetical protein
VTCANTHTLSQKVSRSSSYINDLFVDSQPVYAPDMPARLPPVLLLRRLAQQSFFALLFGLRAVAVAIVWLAVLPWVTVWTWRMYFTMGDSTYVRTSTVLIAMLTFIILNFKVRGGLATDHVRLLTDPSVLSTSISHPLMSSPHLLQTTHSLPD